MTTYDIPVTALIAKPGSETHGLLARRETAFIIRLETMQVVRKLEGNLAGIGDSSAKVLMQELLDTYLQ